MCVSVSLGNGRPGRKKSFDYLIKSVKVALGSECWITFASGLYQPILETPPAALGLRYSLSVDWRPCRTSAVPSMGFGGGGEGAALGSTELVHDLGTE